ncbi:hypothetical protein MKEN_00096200 [Mycena kentingensis (nom. inval.)]|nr:hypothetical protein MKEN_00096200 [Mycena kentingensis (nom. inval.)]
MRFLLVLSLLLCLFPLIHAIPATSDPASRDTPSASHSTSHSSAKNSATPASSTLASSTHKAVIDTELPPDATRTHEPTVSPSHLHHDHGGRAPSTAIVVFEILGVLAAVLVLLGIARCLFIYRRTPGHDRIAAIVDRHRLHRELQQLERNPTMFRRTSVSEPPPPPYLRPPDYEDEHTPLSRSRPHGSNPSVSFAAEQTHLRPNG